jgi:Restriction endonuclease S subunits
MKTINSLTETELAEVPKLPEGWKWVRFEEITENFDGKRKPLSSKFRESFKGKYPYYGACDIIDHVREYIFDGDYLLIGEDGANLLSKAKPLAFSVKGKFWVNNHAHILKTANVVNQKYLEFQFNSLQINKYVTGTAQPKLNQSNLNKIPIAICPLPEQRAIVSKIEQLFSELDNGISNLKLAQEQLKVYRQAVLKKAFEGELTKKWREQQTDLPDAGDLLEQIKKEREKAAKLSGKKLKQVKPFTEDELAALSTIPDEWKWVKTAEIIDPINNGYTPKANFLSSRSGEIPFIKVYNLNFDGSFNFQKDPTFIPKIIHRKELARSVTYPGDVLINIVGPPLGKVSIVSRQFPEWNINQAIVLFRPNNWVTTKIISYYLQNPKTIQWLENTSKATAGQFNVKVSTCREIPFPLISMEEQKAIVQEIETRLSVCDKIEQDIETNLERAEALRQSILKKAFEGKLLNEKELAEVRGAEDWEPAEVLLERIKAGKADNGKK